MSYWKMLSMQPSLSQMTGAALQAYNDARASSEREKMNRLAADAQKRRFEIEDRDLQTARDREALLPEAMQAYAQGRPQMLQTVSPEHFQQAEERRIAGEREVANRRRWLAMAVQSGQMTPEQARAEELRLGMTPDLGPLGVPPPRGMPTPDERRAASTALETQAAGVLGPSTAAIPKALTEAGRRVADMGMPPGSPGYDDAVYEMQREMNEESLRRGKASRSSINIGTDATRTVQTQQQGRIIDAWMNQRTFERLRGLAGEDPATGAKADWRPFLQTVNQAGAWGANKAERWGSPQLKNLALAAADMSPAQLENYNQFRAVLDKYRGEEFKRLLGSAQTETEIKNLVNSIISADMSPSQFDAAIKNLEVAEKRALGIAQQVLQMGFQPQTPQYKAMFQALDMQARTAQKQAEDAALGDLRDLGYTDAELREGGLLDE